MAASLVGLSPGRLVLPELHCAGLHWTVCRYWDENGSETHLGCGELDLPDTEYSHVRME